MLSALGKYLQQFHLDVLMKLNKLQNIFWLSQKCSKSRTHYDPSSLYITAWLNLSAKGIRTTGRNGGCLYFIHTSQESQHSYIIFRDFSSQKPVLSLKFALLFAFFFMHAKLVHVISLPFFFFSSHVNSLDMQSTICIICKLSTQL